jgi:hypothetical protein
LSRDEAPRQPRRRVPLPHSVLPVPSQEKRRASAPPDRGGASAPADLSCSLCGEAAGAGMLVFLHEHTDVPDYVSLNIRLCESCGNRIEKHLKRAIPKRLMVFRSMGAPAPQPDPLAPASMPQPSP